MKKVSLAIIIPVYNEERYLAACLNAIAAQTEQPDEVFVVDNNCTDKTVEIARGYPFVKVLHEKRQGQVFAQAEGFNAAKSDILGRIDGDTILGRDWVKNVKKEFAADAGAVGIFGPASFYDVFFKRTAATVFGFFQRRVVSLFAGSPLMWGANSALRQSAWVGVRGKLNYRQDIWEDYDLSFFLAEVGMVKLAPGLRATASSRSGHKSLPQQVSYQFRLIRTFRLHRGRLRSYLLMLVWCFLALLFPLSMLDAMLFSKK